MRWKLTCRGVLTLDEINENEAAVIKKHIDTFLNVCEVSPGCFRHPGLDQHLRKVLAELCHRLPGAEISFNYRSLKPLLRWCITEGPQLQDERRDNARRLWRVLFNGDLPDFVRWNATCCAYEEDLDGYLRWASGQAKSVLETDGVDRDIEHKISAEVLISAKPNGGISAPKRSLYVSRVEAREILRTALVEAGIPLKSKTARCMFQPTRDSHGQNRCKFGSTPLWDNELQLVQGQALRSEFMEWVARLCDSGHAHQRAAQAAGNF